MTGLQKVRLAVRVLGLALAFGVLTGQASATGGAVDPAPVVVVAPIAVPSAPASSASPPAAVSAAPAAAPVAAEAASEAPAQPTKVKLGMFVTQLYDFDMAKRSFAITFWQWFLHDDDKYKPLESVEIVNAKSTSTKYPSTEEKKDIEWFGEKKNIKWVQGKYYAVIDHNWDIAKFPFDRQVLTINIEDAVNDINQTIFVPDTDNSMMDASIKVPGWIIESFHIGSSKSEVKSTFGDPTLEGSSTYSRVTATISVKRDGLRLLFSSFIGFFVAFMLISLTYFLDGDWMAGSRIGLCGGAIFASVGNKYVVDNMLPPASSFILADAIEVSTFCAIVFAIVAVVLVRAVKDKYPATAWYINFTGGLLSIGGYIIFNTWAILRAAS